MSGYQSIPSADIDCIENGAPSDLSLSDDGCSSSIRPSPLSTASSSSLASKLGFISLGIIIGCITSSRGLLLGWGAVVDNNNVQTLGKSSPIQSPISSTPQESFLVNGKSFLDSLPFEEVIPASWDPAQHRSSGSSSLESSVSNVALMSLSTVKDEASLLSTPLLGLGASTASIPSTTTTTTPHLLYHAHQSAFGLLYDPSKSSNNYLSEYSLDYFLINSGGFDAQINQAYCAVASVATLLNSLKYAKRFREIGDLSGWTFDLPIDSRYDPYPYATQQDILEGDCVYNTVIEYGQSFDGVFAPPYGLTLEQSGKLLKCHTSSEWDVSVQEVDPNQLTLARVRYELKTALIDPDARVMINYDRKGLGQMGGGHFSPLGSYHAPTDSFLVVDVAKYKYPPVWVAADTLFSAMATVDNCGTWDYPKGQERLMNSSTTAGGGKVFNPKTPADYRASLDVLNCKQKMRGYVILRKKGLA